MATYFIQAPNAKGKANLACKFQCAGERIFFTTNIEVDVENWRKSREDEESLRAYKCSQEGSKVYRLIRHVDSILAAWSKKGQATLKDDVKEIQKTVKAMVREKSRKEGDGNGTKVLYPIKREYVKRIFDGSKAYEFRKSFCKPGIDTMVIYESAGRGKIVGECKIVGRICCDPEKMWTLCKENAGIAEKDFFEYFNGCDKACAYVIGDVNIFLVPRTLADYGIDFPPQNYYYIMD